MVAVKSYEADRFLASPPSHIFLYLIFGNDAGLVSERRTSLLRTLVSDPDDALLLTCMSGDDIASDPIKLLDEAHAISLFGGKRVISIEAGGRSFIASLETLLKTPPLDCCIVLHAGTLKKDAPLRKLLDREKAAATIECFPDRPQDIESLINSSMKAANIQIDPEARGLLSHVLGGDRLSTRSELAKLILYADGEKSIQVEHVENIIANASALALDSIVQTAFSGNCDIADETGTRFLQSGGDPNSLLGAILRYTVALQRAAFEMENGAGVEQAASSMLRMGIFVQKQILAGQLARWKVTRLANTIVITATAVAKARRDSAMADVISLRLIWFIARSAGRS